MSDIKKDLLGKQVLGVKFESSAELNYLNEMDDYVGVAGEVIDYLSYIDGYVVEFFNSWDSTYTYPAELLKEVTESETNVSTNLCKESVVEETPVELKLEVGKSYVDGAGNVVKIVKMRDGDYPALGDNMMGYALNGVWSILGNSPESNLVREFIDDSENTFKSIRSESNTIPEGAITEYMKNVWGDELGKKEDVTNPRHYTDGKIEVIDFIEDKNLGFHLGNAVKYIARMGKKDIANPKDDARKAIWYIERYISTQLKD